MKKPAYVITFIFVTILILSVVQVMVSNSISTTGKQLDDLQKAISSYKKQNTLLHEQILEASSLTHIASVAATMGFVPSKTSIAISSPLPIALKQ